MPKLLIIIGSTRPGRAGLPIARWIETVAREHGGFDVEVADLAEIALPFMDEPGHPRLGDYQHDHTKAWSATVASADAFVMVTPEYNYGFPAPLKNAIDFLHDEWQHKPVGIVSYGGVAAGTRAAQMLKQVLTTLAMVPLSEAVSIPFHATLIDADGALQANAVMQASATTMLDAVARWETGLRVLREDAPAAA